MKTKHSWRATGLLAAVAVTATIGLMAPSAATAATPSPVEPPPANGVVTSDAPQVQLSPQEQADVDAITAATDFEARAFDATQAGELGASDEAVDVAASTYVGAGWAVTGSYTENAQSRQIGAAAQACSGKSGYNGPQPPWGYQVALNSCQTDKLISLVTLGGAGAAGITALLAVIGVPKQVLAVAGLITAVIGFGVAALQACKTFGKDNAIYVNVAGTPVVSCWGQ